MNTPIPDNRKTILQNGTGAALAALLLFDMSVAVDGGIWWRHILPLWCIVLCSLLLKVRSNDAVSSPARKSRSLRLDYLRLLAVVGVITIHVIDALFPFLTTEVTGDFLIVQQGMRPEMMKTDALIRTCCLGFNIVYIMLSGALLLPWKEEKLSDFYLRRFGKVFLPFFIFFFFYEWQNGLLFPFTGAHMREMLQQFFTGDTPNSPFYWLIYIILSLYLVYPFMRYMLKDLPYPALTLLCAGITFFSGTVAYTSFVFAPVIGSWLGFALLGYWITRTESRRFDKYLLLLFLVQVGIIARLIWKAERYEDYIGKIVQYTPIMIFLVLGYFAFIYLLPQKILKEGKFLHLFNKYSFSVILTHWWVLYFILGRYYSARPNYFTRLYLLVRAHIGTHASLLFLIIADTLLSLGVGILLEEYFLRAPMWLFDRLTDRLRQNRK